VIEVDQDGVSIAPPDRAWPAIDVFAVPERKAVKNRLHLDLRADGSITDNELQRLLSLGAQPVDVGQGPDVVRWPYAEAARSLIHEADIAAVAVRALTQDGHTGQTYVLTGPETLTQTEQVHAIGEAIARPLRFEEISPDEARPGLVAALGDEAFADGALHAWATFVTQLERVTSTVQEITGTPARTLREWAADHADDFR